MAVAKRNADFIDVDGGAVVISGRTGKTILTLNMAQLHAADAARVMRCVLDALNAEFADIPKSGGGV